MREEQNKEKAEEASVKEELKTKLDRIHYPYLTKDKE